MECKKGGDRAQMRASPPCLFCFSFGLRGQRGVSLFLRRIAPLFKSPRMICFSLRISPEIFERRKFLFESSGCADYRSYISPGDLEIAFLTGKSRDQIRPVLILERRPDRSACGLESESRPKSYIFARREEFSAEI